MSNTDLDELVSPDGFRALSIILNAHFRKSEFVSQSLPDGFTLDDLEAIADNKYFPITWRQLQIVGDFIFERNKEE